MDQVIEPSTANLNTEDQNQNGGLPVMSEETIANAQPPEASEPIAPQLYTLLDNGEYQSKMDILYPPETVFYVQHPDGSFTPEGIPDHPYPTPAAQEITLEYMIEKSTEFLIQNGYHVFPPGDKPVQVEFESLNADLKTQISQLKDQLAAAQKPVKPGDRAVEASIRFAKMRSMIGSHFPTQALQNEANSIITELEAFF